MRRSLHIALLAAAAVLLAACSLTKLAYMNAALAYSKATPVLTWMAADYVDLSDTQKDWVRERLAGAFAWHRAQELPEYRRFLEKVLAQSEDSISVEEARTAHQEVRRHYHRLMDRVIPDIADFLLQMDAEQVGQLERKFAEDHRKMLRDATKGTPESRMRKRVERYVDHLEEWTGSLTAAQRRIVAERVAAMEEPALERRLEDRKQRHDATLAIARGKPSREEASTALRRLLVETETWRNPDYLRTLKARDQQLFEMIASLSASLDAEQREQFRKRVQRFMSDITELTAGLPSRAG